MEENELHPETESAAPVTVCDVFFRPDSKTYYFDPAGLALKPGDEVIIETARGPEFGYVGAAPHEIPATAVVPPLRKVLRRATDQDRYVNDQNRKLETIAYRTCQEKVEQLGLDMQLVSCETAFDGSKLLFYFTADDRVDFRELVRILASIFRTRIELRQIGVRDKAKMVGGLGICGRPFCCRSFLSDFAPVSIKMAKTQNLSLNPTKISGTCGRLMCCLKYEQEAYETLLQTSPKTESLVDTPDGRGTITDVNLMGQSVKVRLESDPDEIRSYRNEEIAVLRSGKAKKTDAPIPDSVAPISGERRAPRIDDAYPRFVRPEPAQEEPARAQRRRDAKKPEEQPAAQASPKPEEQPKKQHQKGEAPRLPHRRPKAEAQPEPKAEKKQKGEAPKLLHHRPKAEVKEPEPTSAPKPDQKKKHRGSRGKSGEAAQSAAKAQPAAKPEAEKPAVPVSVKPAETARKGNPYWRRRRNPKKNGEQN